MLLYMAAQRVECWKDSRASAVPPLEEAIHLRWLPTSSGSFHEAGFVGSPHFGSTLIRIAN